MISRAAQLPRNRHKSALGRTIWDSLRPDGDRFVSLQEAADTTYRWLCTAQDATPDDGVSAGLDMLTGRWFGSYPETTGYIIPTFLAYGEAAGKHDARERAIRMADWEVSIQMADGAVLSGPLGTPRGPAVFNTGQGLFGWVAAYQETSDDRYATSAARAADWLLANLDDDGAWRRNLSMITTASVCTYNVRCAWALAYAGTVLSEQRFLDGARLAADWAVSQQDDVGWYARASFADGELPPLHTISYVNEGLLGVHAYTGEESYLAAARRAADRLVELYRADGKLAGAYGERWDAAASWRCVTGDAQTAVVMHRLGRMFPGEGYEVTARALLEDVARSQLRGSGAADDPYRGAVPGSYPVWGRYSAWAAPNWAAKFFLDGLMLELHGVDERSFPLPKVAR